MLSILILKNIKTIKEAKKQKGAIYERSKKSKRIYFIT